jgi:hypothetical protein
VQNNQAAKVSTLYEWRGSNFVQHIRVHEILDLKEHYNDFF